ncbi:MAG: YkgJ family cysteine cluster protein, partial [Thermodesulfovibrionales bacterium]
MDERLKIIVPPIIEEKSQKQRKFSHQTECQRCGQCCRSSSPMLLKEDYHLFISGKLNDINTYTLRLGEPILNRHEQELYILPFEVIKIDEQNMACHFYEGSGECSIYESRPYQCKNFECWNNTPYQEGLENIRLTRQDLFGDIPQIMEIIKKHEEVCSYETLERSIQTLKEGD